MKFLTILKFIIVLSTSYAFYLDLNFGWAYCFATLPLFLGLFIINSRILFFGDILLIVTILALFAFFLIRPLFLIQFPMFFKFDALFEINLSRQMETLISIAYLNILSISTVVIMRFFLVKIPLQEVFLAAQVLRARSKLFLIFLPIGGLYLLISVFAASKPEFGEKLLGYTELLFPLKFMPIYCIALLLISKIKNISFIEKVICVLIVLSYMIAQLMQGSKSFILEIFFMGIIIKLLFFGNFEIKLQRVVNLFFLFFIILLSFPLAMAIRRISAETGLTGISPSILLQRINFMVDVQSYGSFAPFVIDLITKRLNGYDGILSALQISENEFPAELSLTVMIKNGLASILPGVTSEYTSFGQLTSRVFYGFEGDDIHGGGIGAYAMLLLLAKSHLLLVPSIIIFFIILCVNFNLIMRLKITNSLRVCAIVTFFVVFVLAISGGNFDRIFREIFVVLLHVSYMVFYMKLRYR